MSRHLPKCWALPAEASIGTHTLVQGLHLLRSFLLPWTHSTF